MGSQKGSQFERDMAREISLWWTDGKDNDAFWRVLGSGGMATNKVKAGKSITNASFNDIEAKTADAFSFTNKVICELKRGYKNWSIMDIMDSPNVSKQVWAKFHDQVVTAQTSSNRKYWIVIFKRDHRKIMVMMCPSLVSEIHRWYEQKNIVYSPIRIVLRNTTMDGVLVTWDEFKTIDPNFFRE